MSDELKPCPFCGNEKLREWTDTDKVEYVECAHCDIWLSKNSWNSRAAVKERGEDTKLEAIREIVNNYFATDDDGDGERELTKTAQLLQPAVRRAEVSQRPRILLVEDHEDTRRVVALLLRKRGYEVCEAASAEEAIECVRSGDIALLDIGLPGENGWELFSRHLKPLNINAVALTALGSAADVKKSLSLGFSRHIVKPASVEQIEAVLKAVWQTRN